MVDKSAFRIGKRGTPNHHGHDRTIIGLKKMGVIRSPLKLSPGWSILQVGGLFHSDIHHFISSFKKNTLILTIGPELLGHPGPTNTEGLEEDCLERDLLALYLFVRVFFPECIPYAPWDWKIYHENPKSPRPPDKVFGAPKHTKKNQNLKRYLDV